MDIIALVISLVALLGTANLYRSGSSFAKNHLNNMEYIYDVFDHTASRLYKLETDLMSKLAPVKAAAAKKAAPKKAAAKKAVAEKKVAPRKR